MILIIATASNTQIYFRIARHPGTVYGPTREFVNPVRQGGGIGT